MFNLKKISPFIIASCLCLNTAFSAEQCYWMSNTAAGNPWVLAPQGKVDKKTCFNLDSCNGGLGQSGGGCYKWATAPNADRIAWGNVDSAQCYWMSNTAPGNPWVLAPQGKIDKKTCFNLDSCNGGLGQSAGGCYKWATAPNAERIAWDNTGTEQCFWMSNTAPGNPWVAAPQGKLSKKECFNLDSCNGGLGQSSGGCYKWATAANADRIAWDSTGTEQCFWMSNTAPGNQWVAAPQGKLSKKECFNLDSCNGGLGQSSGGCYKWATAPNADRIAWDNISTNAKGPAIIATPIAQAPVANSAPATSTPVANAKGPAVVATPIVQAPVANPAPATPTPVANAKGPAVVATPIAKAPAAPVPVAKTAEIIPLGGTIYRGNNLIYTNNMLTKGMFICSPSKEFAAVYQEDGNFCVYQAPAKPTESKRFIWCTQNKANFEAGKNGAIVLQGDGNLGHYTKCDISARCDGWLWDALKGQGINVQGQSYRLSMQDDGNLVIYNNSDNRFIWGSMATAPSNKGKFSECK